MPVMVILTRHNRRPTPARRPGLPVRELRDPVPQRNRPLRKFLRYWTLPDRIPSWRRRVTWARLAENDWLAVTVNHANLALASSAATAALTARRATPRPATGAPLGGEAGGVT